MLLSLVAIMAFFQVMTDGTLLQPLNLTNLVLQNSYIVIMALGMLLVIVAGHIDLSVGSVVGFIGALAAVLMVRVRAALRAGHAAVPGRGALDRRGAGLVRRLLQHPVVHRHAGRHAGLQGPGAGAAAGPVGRVRSRRRSSCSARASSPTCFAARRCALTSLLLGLAVALRDGRRQAARSARSQTQHGMEDEPLRRSSLAQERWCSSRSSSACQLPAGLVQGPAQRARRHGAADAAATTS